MANPVMHFEIMTRQPAQLRQFYRDAFDWEFQSAGAAGGLDYTTVQNSNGISGGIGASPDGYDGHVTFYVAVDDINQAFAKVESLGGTRMMGPEQVPDGPVIGLFRDPANNIIGLVQP